MPAENPHRPWNRPGWLEPARLWTQTELNQRGLTLDGPIEQPHLGLWSTVLRAPTTGGDIYFKASAPILRHEPALTQALARWRPDCMPHILAIDPERGWMLLADGGDRLRGLIQSTRDLGHWRRLLPRYAEVQIQLSGRLPEMLVLGALDRRLAALPARHEQLLAEPAALRLNRPGGLTSEEYDRLRTITPKIEVMCRQLADFGLPETVQHDDFHDGNIFVRGEIEHAGDAQNSRTDADDLAAGSVPSSDYIFFDWGDCCVSHPFFTLLVTLRSIAYRLELAENAPELMQLRDIYLKSWRRYGSPQKLASAFKLAYRLGMICRALTWHHLLSSLVEPVPPQEAEAVPGWLQEFLYAEVT